MLYRQKYSTVCSVIQLSLAGILILDIFKTIFLQKAASLSYATIFCWPVTPLGYYLGWLHLSRYSSKPFLVWISSWFAFIKEKGLDSRCLSSSYFIKPSKTDVLPFLASASTCLFRTKRIAETDTLKWPKQLQVFLFETANEITCSTLSFNWWNCTYEWKPFREPEDLFPRSCNKVVLSV